MKYLLHAVIDEVYFYEQKERETRKNKMKKTRFRSERDCFIRKKKDLCSMKELVWFEGV